MEQWEKEMRERLEKEFEDGFYQIGVQPIVALTGKQGKINYEVELVRFLNKLPEDYKPYSGIQNQIDNPIPLGEGIESHMSSPTENPLTEQTIRDFMNEIRNKCKP